MRRDNFSVGTDVFKQVRSPYRRVKHLLVDEMQDYTPVQYAVLEKLFNCKKTVLGDVSQSINPYSASKADEIKHKDFCTEGLNTNERESELKARDISELEAEISDLTTTIDELTKSIATLESEIAEMQTQLKRAGEDREKENADFQTTIADQRETQKLLTSALNVLKAVFDKKSFVQAKANPSPASNSKPRRKDGIAT